MSTPNFDFWGEMRNRQAVWRKINSFFLWAQLTTICTTPSILTHTAYIATGSVITAGSEPPIVPELRTVGPQIAVDMAYTITNGSTTSSGNLYSIYGLHTEPSEK